MLKEKFHIAVPTAFFEDESLHIQGTIDHIKVLYKQGVKSVVVSGTTGEQHSMSTKEKIELINRLELEEEIINNMEILFGISSTRQRDAEELAKRVRHTKISGILLAYPPYVIPTQEEALLYTKSILNLSGKPTILYNNPRRTGFDLSVESIIQLSKEDLVVGLKEAGDVEKIGLIKDNSKRNNFHFYAGGEVDLEEKVQLGFDRLSSIAGNIAPLEVSQWFNKLLTEQEMTEQERVKIAAIMEQVYSGSPLVNVKEMINKKGTPIGICRSPIGNVL